MTALLFPTLRVSPPVSLARVNDWLAAGVLNCPFDADALLAASEDEGTSAGAGAGSGAGAGAGAGAADAVARLSESVRPIKESHVPGAGEGRVVTLSEPTSLAAIIDRVRATLRFLRHPVKCLRAGALTPSSSLLHHR